MITDAIGRTVAFVLTSGQDHELPHAIPLLNKLSGVPKWVAADRATAGTPSASTSGTWAHAQ